MLVLDMRRLYLPSTSKYRPSYVQIQAFLHAAVSTTDIIKCCTWRFVRIIQGRVIGVLLVVLSSHLVQRHLFIDPQEVQELNHLIHDYARIVHV